MYLDLVGQTQGFQDVDIRARVEGFLDTVNFREGSFVRKGDLLYQIDPKPLEAALAQAKADMATAAGAAREGRQRRRPLHAARGQAGGQPAGARRRAGGAGRHAIAGRGRPRRRSTRRRSISATRGSSSPISGLIGTTQVKPGSLVGRGESTLLTTISPIDPIIFRVGVTEADYLRIIKRDPTRAGQEAQTAGIELTLADGTTHPADRHGRAGRARGQQLHRHARRAALLPEPRQRPAARPVRAGARCCSRRRPARCWFRSAPCRSCRTCTASRSSAPTTRSRSATSRSARGSTRSGSSKTGSSPASRSSPRGSSRCATA